MWRAINDGAPAKIALAYLFLAGLWILLSDKMIPGFIEDPGPHWQTYKGWAFVGVTGLLLYLLLARGLAARKSLQSRLVETNETLRAVIQASPVAIVCFDPDLKVSLWNPAAERMFGWSEGEMLGKDYAAVVPGDERKRFLANVSAVRRGAVIRGMDLVRHTKDGSRVDVTLWTSPIRDPRGEPKGAVAILVDTTQKRALERELHQAQKMEIVGQLAGGVAHDFNNLLTGIMGFTSLALDTAAPGSDAREKLLRVGELAERAARLTRQLLRLSRRERFDPVTLDLNELTAASLGMLERLIGQEIQVHFEPANDAAPIAADPGQIEQVLMNLVVNARDAMPEGGKLILETRHEAISRRVSPDDEEVELKPGEYVVLSVTDTGRGMDREVARRAFEPFFTTKKPEEGTGLGLTVVYRIVRRHGGHISLNTRVGGGTTFVIHFPRADGNADRAPLARGEELMPRGTETVLVIDDEEPIRIFVDHVLRELGYGVVSARAPREALAMLSERFLKIDLILSDVASPGTGIGDLFRGLTYANPSVRILHMSGYESKELRARAAGIAFLPKPFTPSLLARKVREVLDEPKPAATAGPDGP
jgi:two-component system, cell cycle sensor histidine kinase and response regulator CckA